MIDYVNELREIVATVQSTVLERWVSGTDGLDP